MPNDTLFVDFCRQCGSTNLAELPEVTNNKYHSRLVCADCKTFLKWIPKAKILEVSISKILQNPTLEEWERQFLKAVILRTPTNAEEIVITAIEAKLNPVSNERGVS
ncbi:hypothetical protein [Scytonema sp. PCC 10023]|uniref:hypothetical protein n=1 Tax=Scytonema sp. PCC 10023 TaxID=1680591 RepID=UPI0039C70444